MYLGAWGGSRRRDPMAALRADPPPPVCRWGRRPQRGATACRLLERFNPGIYLGAWGGGRRRDLMAALRAPPPPPPRVPLGPPPPS